ncbi:hypothetical protein D3C80_421860 [compost metagenome]
MSASAGATAPKLIASATPAPNEPRPSRFRPMPSDMDDKRNTAINRRRSERVSEAPATQLRMNSRRPFELIEPSTMLMSVMLSPLRRQ